MRSQDLSDRQQNSVAIYPSFASKEGHTFSRLHDHLASNRDRDGLSRLLGVDGHMLIGC